LCLVLQYLYMIHVVPPVMTSRGELKQVVFLYNVFSCYVLLNLKAKNETKFGKWCPSKDE